MYIVPVVLFALLAAALCSAKTANENFIAVSNILFPESKDWIDIEHSPTLPVSEVVRRRDSLTKSVITEIRQKNNLFPLYLDKDCSFSKQAFKWTGLTCFHRLNIDHDGIEDIVYAGPAQCFDGTLTVIWFGAAGGHSIRQTLAWPSFLLRVSPDGHKAISVAVGCCDSATDKYFYGDLTNLYHDHGLLLAKKTELPSTAYSKLLSFTANGLVKLRSSPETIDSNDRNRIDWEDGATGNIVRTYMAGSKGLIVGEIWKITGRWVFVVMNTECKAIAQHDYYDGVRAGWLRANEVRIIRK